MFVYVWTGVCKAPMLWAGMSSGRWNGGGSDPWNDQDVRSSIFNYTFYTHGFRKRIPSNFIFYVEATKPEKRTIYISCQHEDLDKNDQG